MNRSKYVKFLALGATTIVTTGAPIAIVYTIDKHKSTKLLEAPPTVQKQLFTSKKPLAAFEIFEGIIKGTINPLKLTTNDFMKLITAIKSSETSTLKIFIRAFAPKIVEKIEQIDNDIWRWFFDLVLNRGIATLKPKDTAKLEAIASLVFDPKKDSKWIEIIGLLPKLISDGMGKVIFDNNHALFNAKALSLANYFLNKLKPQLKNKDELVNKITSFIKKLFIDGYNDQIANGQVVKTAQVLMTDDIVELIYLFSDHGVLKTKISTSEQFNVPVLGQFKISIRDTIHQIILSLVHFMRTPTKSFLEPEIQSLTKQLATEQAKTKELTSKISDLEVKLARNKLATNLSSVNYETLIAQLATFKTHKYSYLMFKLGLDEDALADIDAHDKDYHNQNNKFLHAKWYENIHKGYWVLARSLWNFEPNQIRGYDSKSAWYRQVASDWKYGITFGGWGWFSDPGGPAISPNSKRLEATVQRAYNSQILARFAKRWSLIQAQESQTLLRDNANQPIIAPPFSRSQFKIVEELKMLKDEIATTKEAAKLTLATTKRITAELDRIKQLHAYKYEQKHQITTQKLASNRFFKGQGLLKLSADDITNIFYKVQDLFINKDYYLEAILNRVIKKVASRAIHNWQNDPNLSSLDWLLRQGMGLIITASLPLLQNSIKIEIRKLLDPYINKMITPDLVAKIQFINPVRAARIIHNTINQGLGKIPNASLIYGFLIAEKFTSIKFSHQDLLTIIVAFKRGLHALPFLNRVALSNFIIDNVTLKPTLKLLIKDYISRNPSQSSS